MNLDLNIYPETYSVFNKPRQYLIRNHVANLESKPNKNKTITHSPGFKRICELSRYSNDAHLTPLNLPELSQKKPYSSMGNYQISYFPTSPLNPELEEQCAMLEIFRNMKSINVHKLKIKTPQKAVRKPKKFDYDAGFKKIQNFSVIAEKNNFCYECQSEHCTCNPIDKISEEIHNKFSVNCGTDNPKDSSTFSISPFIPKAKLNQTKQNFIKKTTKRKQRHASMDLESLRRSLQITPVPLSTLTDCFKLSLHSKPAKASPY